MSLTADAHVLVKRKAISRACILMAASCATMSIANAGTLPQGGQFAAGTGSIGTNGATLTVTQSSARGVIDWNSFSIGSGNQVSFNNGSGATLNRVTGGNATSILGSLSATGSVYLINPQGIVIGSTGVVTTGGRFVASTLDVDDTSFMNGGALTLTGASTHNVVNLGKIGSTHGDVFLVAAGEVENAGSVSAPEGTAEFAAGRKILLQDASSGRQVFVQTGSQGTVLDSGTIAAAQVSLQAADGNVYALSGNHDAIRATGTATRDGHVWLVADTGTVELPQSIAATNVDGSGGTVDTVAGKLTFCNCTPTVTAGMWNITMPNYVIGSADAGALSRSLGAGTSINVATTGAAGAEGDINVAGNLAWSGGATLALNAYRAVTLGSGKTIANSGSGSLTLRADATSIDNGGGVLSVGTIDWSKSTGTVNLYSDMNGTYVPGTLLGNAAWVPSLASGIVTQITGYRLVNSVADLQNVTNDLAGNYALGRDISVGGPFTPIGTYSSGPSAAFTGQFDGLGHAIDGASTGTSGLFYQIGGSGVVRNLGVTNSNIGYGQCYSDACYTGLLTQENDGLIARSYSTGSFGFDDFGPGTSYSVGGLVGLNNGTIEQSWSSAYIGGMPDFSGGPGAGDLGGLVGDNNGLISQSYATGAVSGGSWAFVGGLVGRSNGAVTQSFATGVVSGGGGSFWFGPGGGAGGLIGGGSGGGSDDYWNAQTSGLSTDSGGVPAANGLTTAQMSDPSSFVGWDFSANGVWTMPSGSTYPQLRWQVAPAAGVGAQAQAM
ncbi:two-partner secretion domain-containing protein [Trinickia sp.]|uniref:two-partner secretion domain-containing protein n=1 Tax=Trinickia sp. TaxID=2571163 RepID=UPI003F818BD9